MAEWISNIPSVSEFSGHELVNDVSIIIREAGERTLALCRALAEAAVGSERVAIVSEVPSEKGLRRVFELGCEMDTPWILELDADVLLRGGAVQKLVHVANQLDENVFLVQGQILDKLCQGFRDAGQHLYRTSLLRTGLGFIPPEGEFFRPETLTFQRMKLAGFPFLTVTHIVTGLHDHEQYLRDVWRKAFFHAAKHSFWTPYVRPMWRRLGQTESDFRAALLGLERGLNSKMKVRPDIRLFDPGEIKRHLLDHGLEEKPELPADAMTLEDVSRRIAEFVPPPEYWNLMVAWGTPAPEKSAPEKIRDFVSEKGFFRLLPWLLGAGLTRIGQKLKNAASRPERIEL